MAILRANQVRELDNNALSDKIAQLQLELNAERGQVKTGGRASNTGRQRIIRRTLARLMTIAHERTLGINKQVRERKKGARAFQAKAKKEAEEKKSKEAAKAASAPEEEEKTPEQVAEEKKLEHVAQRAQM